MKTQKKYFSKEYKLKAVSLCEERENMSSVAKELGLRPDMLSRWNIYWNKMLVKNLNLLLNYNTFATVEILEKL